MPTKDGAVTFDEWWIDYRWFDDWTNKEIAITAWNAGVKSACLIFGMNEGVDFGAEEELTVRE